jgi:hypothetical protein
MNEWPRLLPTRADYDAAEPLLQGYMAYRFSTWPGSKIPSEKECPYAEGTEAHALFHKGVQAAVTAAIDNEE